ncbi:MAG: hypothetical protein MJA31_12940 [Clostridia bacterium]|nr:hypothetical protein [Clostridia bacterium]
MKKFLSLMLVIVLVLSSAVVAFAAEPQEGEKKERINIANEFNEELHQIIDLRIEKNDLNTEILTIKDGMIDAKAEKDELSEAVKEAVKGIREELKGINGEVKALSESIRETKAAFKEAIKAQDMDEAEALLEQEIQCHETVNDYLEDKIALLNEILETVTE